MIRKKVNGKIYPFEHLDAELRRVAGLWKKNAQAKLRRDKKNASGKLTRSMKITTGSERGNAFVDLTPTVYYWQFVEFGVRGAQSSPFPRQRESPFRFRNKMPPVKAIEQWIKIKGLVGRDKKGRFMERTRFAWLISKAIWRRGIKPTFFISDTGDRIRQKYAQSITEAFARDLEEILQNRTQ